MKPAKPPKSWNASPAFPTFPADRVTIGQVRARPALGGLIVTGSKAPSLAKAWFHNAAYGAILAAVDCAAIACAFLAAFQFRLLAFPKIQGVAVYAIPAEPYLDMPWLILVWIAVFFYEGLYARGLGSWDELVRIPKCIFFSALLTVGATFLYHSTQAFSRIVLVSTPLFALFSVSALRVYSKSRFLLSAFPIRVLVFGSSAAAGESARPLLPAQCGYKTLAVVALAGHCDEEDLRDLVCRAVAEHDPDEIVVDSDGFDEPSLRKILRSVEAVGRPVRLLSSPSSLHLQASVQNVDGLLLVDLNQGLSRPLSRLIKRAADLIGATVLLILCAPLFLVVGILIKLDSPGPIFYGHRRLAPGGGTFRCLKFRTMFRDAEQRLRSWMERGEEKARQFLVDFKLKDDPRVTRVGKFLRKLSIDELPQLVNVLRGEMSLVGPRPIVIEEASKYGRDCQYLLAIKGGMTGLWQVSGRNDVDYSERIALDTYYARNWSCWLDLVILMKTLPTVLKRSGAY